MTEMAEAKYFIEYRKLSEGLDWNGWARIRFFGTLTYAEACEELLKQKKADDYVGERNFEYRIVNSDGLVVLRDGGEPAAPPASVEPSGKVLVPVEEWDRLKAVEGRLEALITEKRDVVRSMAAIRDSNPRDTLNYKMLEDIRADTERSIVGLTKILKG